MLSRWRGGVAWPFPVYSSGVGVCVCVFCLGSLLCELESLLVRCPGIAIAIVEQCALENKRLRALNRRVDARCKPVCRTRSKSRARVYEGSIRCLVNRVLAVWVLGRVSSSDVSGGFVPSTLRLAGRLFSNWHSAYCYQCGSAYGSGVGDWCTR